MSKITTIDDVQAAVQATPHLAIRGGGSKSALAEIDAGIDQERTLLDLQGLSGILEYEPGEYTFTALAGTPLHTVAAALAEHDQFLPFDPPLVEAGATLGGTVATGLSGAGRYRYGGVRDFLIGVRFVDGQGRLVRGGGKVVKNAAGFDLPKLMVNSLGQFGVLVEVSFKVFPRPQSYQTLVVHYSTLPAALAGMQQMIDSHFDVYALDLAVADEAEHPFQLAIRLGGLPQVMAQRTEQMRQVLTQSAPVRDNLYTESDDAALWAAANSFGWMKREQTLVKVATTPSKLSTLDEFLAASGAQRRYAVGGNLAWIAWPKPLTDLDTQLTTLGLSGIVLLGKADRPFLGMQTGQQFAQRIKSALDPHNRLPNYYQ
ncbi:MAG: FAD-binding protein [Caldilineaceae bacterium]|nr:FAD-binding protein [Caldilineaceae bacterium]